MVVLFEYTEQMNGMETAQTVKNGGDIETNVYKLTQFILKPSKMI